jgi:hypothetical protein
MDPLLGAARSENPDAATRNRAVLADGAPKVGISVWL